ncbi:IS66 family insertion sequence element accessory protein TnpB [candidate division KSB1 bacterium]|nr:IS66 family insertion sequence element accessory protein TnpB [candidate division KSB1 bacterium]
MFWTPGNQKFYFYRHPTDMRKSFNGLCGIVTGILKEDPLDGSVYIFVNKRRNLIKLLLWDSDGFWIFYKRLEKGTFQIPELSDKSSTIEFSYEELMMLIKGIDLKTIKRRTRYKRKYPLVG